MIQAMKSQNLLQKKWYVIDSQTTKGKYKQGDTIKFETETIKSSLCDYSDVFILVTGNIAVAANNNTDVAFKNVHHFLNVKEKLMMYLLMKIIFIFIIYKQIIFTLQCLLQLD